jgi:hypothetical protein
VFWFFLQLLSNTFLVLTRIQHNIIIYVDPHVKCPLFLSHFNASGTFMTFLKHFQVSNFIKIHPVGAELYHHRQMVRLTDLTKLMVILCSFVHVLNEYCNYTDMCSKFFIR